MAMVQKVFVAGYPGDVGGANTECWHTVKLWRRFGLEVTCIPTWPEQLSPQSLARWGKRLAAIGARTCLCSPDALGDVPGIADQAVVGFCNVRLLEAAEKFRALGCRIIWLGCMNWLFPAERLHYRRHGLLDRYVFQSRFQRDQLEPQLRKFGYHDAQGLLVRGAFDCSEFPFRPRSRRLGETFVVGRLSRAAADKFHPHTWSIYARVAAPIRARILGWDPQVEAALGSPPCWAEVLAPGAETSRQFLSSLDCLLMAGAAAIENWPRAGLEAMAAGVPIVTDNRGGWPEMIRHGETGYLADTPRDLADYATRLAANESQRLEMAHAARQAVEVLCHPEATWLAWSKLFAGLHTNGA